MLFSRTRNIIESIIRLQRKVKVIRESLVCRCRKVTEMSALFIAVK